MSRFIKLISNVIVDINNELTSTVQCVYCNASYLRLTIKLHQEICEKNPNNFIEPSQEIYNPPTNLSTPLQQEIYNPPTNFVEPSSNHVITSCQEIYNPPTNLSTPNDKITIYVLLLEDGRYYIGKSTTVDFRLEQHFNGYGSTWTKKYKPIKVVEIIPNSDTFDEDKYTLKYMSKYGIDMVRGGSFCQIELSDQAMQILKQMLTSTNDKCYNCGEIGHYSNKCPGDNMQIKNVTCYNCGEIGHYSTRCPVHTSDKIQPKVIKCKRCGRINHTTDNCYARKHINGSSLCTKNQVTISNFLCRYCQRQFSTAKGAVYHENMYCRKNLSKSYS